MLVLSSSTGIYEIDAGIYQVLVFIKVMLVFSYQVLVFVKLMLVFSYKYWYYEFDAGIDQVLVLNNYWCLYLSSTGIYAGVLKISIKHAD